MADKDINAAKDKDIKTDMIETILNDINTCDMILIGMGEEMAEPTKTGQGIEGEEIPFIEIMDKFAKLLEHKNYFVICTEKNVPIEESKLNSKRVLNIFGSATDEDIEKQWEFYNKWLAATLNKKLVILELGEGFLRPDLIRWPFEKITFINQKSNMYRVNSKFPQIPDNIKEKAFPVKENAFTFIMKAVHRQTNNG